MPFENQVVVVQMKGSAILEMIDYLKIARRAHPISGMTLHITKKGILKKLLIQGKPLSLDNVYNVATSDYLLNGGDRMDFFKKNNAVYYIDYKIRNILVDYFKAKDTLNPKRDMRFIYTK
jgi:5'-nucleotidase